jgi:2,3-bisphosphoglycerate-dependent phosphoglycerate mutase
MKKLFYVRHGQADANVVKVFGGHSEVLLTSVGKNQAKKAGREARLTLPTIDVIICSPLRRAQDTAAIIAKELGYPLGKIELNDLLIERSYGVLEGTRSHDFFKEHDPDELDNVQGAEAAEHLRQRAVRALKYLKSRKEDNILVVSHGAFGNAFLSAVRKVPYSYGSFDKEPKNAEIVELI